jgi:hypothetical protein
MKVDPADLEWKHHGSLQHGGSTLPPKQRMILSLQLHGFRRKEIAERLGMHENSVSRVVHSKRYLDAFDARLDELDAEFLRLKPAALRALADGLNSRDEVIKLRAAEVWFKLTGQGGYGRDGSDAGPKATAEDIAQALLAAGGGTVTIRAEPHTQAEEAGVILLEPSAKSVH